MSIQLLPSGLRRKLRHAQGAAALAMGLAASTTASFAAPCQGTDQRGDIDPALRAEMRAQLDTAPFSEGLFWTAQRGDRIVFVIGTYHLNDPRFVNWVPVFEQALNGADLLLVESTDEDQIRLQKELSQDMSRAFISDGPSLIERLDKAEWAHIAALAKAAGVPTIVAAKMQPWFLSLALAMPLCAKQDPTIKNGLDARLIAAARTKGTDVRALEDAMTVIRMLSDVPIDKQVEDLRSYLTLAQADENQLASLSAAYFDEQVLEYALQEELRFLTAPGPKSRSDRAIEMAGIMDKLLYRRNKAWLPVIEAAVGDHIVVAVGALHLPGKDGVLQLLQNAGYDLRRQALPKP